MSVKLIIGIDSGVVTGYAEHNCKKLIACTSMTIHKAMDLVKTRIEEQGIKSVLVLVEDARRRKFFGESGREKLQGAGSIKRDAKIWEDYLTDLGVSFQMIAPKDNRTKLSSAAFKNETGWNSRTNEHARDAAMLIFSSMKQR